MYAPHFGLRQRPFSIAPDPRYLFMSERHREALAHLLYGVRAGGGFVVLTGEIGAGKTTVCRSFLEQIPEGCEVAYVFNPKLTVEELLGSICAEFRIPYQHSGAGTPTVKDYVDALNEYLLRMHAVGRNNILIIDEAQSLSAEVLEQLRLLTNLETNEHKLLQIVLIGQPELRAMLARPGLEQLSQRVIARYHLGALSETESKHYVAHRLAVAGLTQASPFSGAAMRRIYRYSRGVPRRINLLCDRALLGAYAKGDSRVDQATVDAAAKEVLEKPDLAMVRRKRYERVALLAAGLATGAALVGAITLALDRTGRQNTPAAQAANANPAASVPAAGASTETRSAETPASAAVSTSASTASTAAAKTQPSATASVPAAAVATPALAATAFDLPTGFARLVDAKEASWGELARIWGIAPLDGDPCLAARAHQIQCYRNPSITLALIRQLDRPGILTLHDADKRTAHALLVGLSDKDATLRIGGAERSVSLVSLADYWRGEFATFWRAPPGYTGVNIASSTAPSARWLARQLAAARGDTEALKDRFDDTTLKGWVHAFQLTQGLPSDGLAGPVTLMRLNQVIGVEEPRLRGEN